MRPLRILMKGFGAFREMTEIDLSDVDLVALVGPTGSGKSTIIDAITFALYGTVARYEDNRLVAPVINQTSNEARVSLDFELGGQVFTAVRIVRRTTGGATTKEASLERGEEVLAGDARSMSQEVEALLGLDVDRFNRTVVLPQGKFAAFLHDKPSDRQTTLVQLLGVGLYRRIGKAARRRAARANAQAEVLRPDLASETRDLTDERRGTLEKRVAQLDTVRSKFRADLDAISDLDAELSDLDGDIQRLNDRIDRMHKVVEPVGVAELADQISKATRARSKAEQHRKERIAERRLAKETLENGPDIANVHLGLKAHSELAQRIQEHDAVVKKLEEAVQGDESAERAADRVREKQAELDRCVEEAREAEKRARTARDAAITVTQVDAWSTAHSRYEAASKNARETAQAVRSAEASIQPLQGVLRDAASVASEGSAQVTELRRRAGVLGHVDLLEVGSDCPLCLQEVHELPAHDLDTDLRQAEADNEAALAARAGAEQACENAETALIERRADASSALKALSGYESDTASIPPSDQLDTLRAKATKLTDAVCIAGEATRQAANAASQHRESTTCVDALKAERVASERVTGLVASEKILQTQLTSLQAKVACLPSEDELSAQLTEAKRLQAEQKEADRRFEGAETEYQSASARLAAVNSQREQAIELVHASRARVTEFGPPIVDTSDLVGAWATLTKWTLDEARAASAKRRVAVDKKSANENLRTARHATLRARCVNVLDDVDPDATVFDMGDLLTNQAASAAADLKHFDERRDKLRKLEKRVDNLTEQAEVAGKLGRLLRADRFEDWLMEAALDKLVERATKRLYELSSGQYSLTVHKRYFAVRDHTNADELRSARTLSGGETFLASLALALALADATAEIAAEGAPIMESIFLDEGFGTLDPQTLDTVAAAVEELGTTGRFVGIVTHIRDLADRMPVRLEVTKTGGSATVERVEF